MGTLPQESENTTIPLPDAGDRVERARILDRLESRLFATRTSRVSFGRYLVAERIGTGGFGYVYRAFDPALDRDVAIKFVRSRRRLGGPTALIDEARAVAQLQHPNVVEVFDVGHTSGWEPAGLGVDCEPDVFIVMELLRGRTLREWAEQEKPDRVALLAALLDAASGLAAAHAAGIVHRDFKPTNVIVTDEGGVRVLDFGLATPATSALTVRKTPDTEHIEDRRFAVGTPAYMARETHGASPGTAASDQFAFAVSFIELWCGSNPYRSMSLLEMGEAKRRPIPPGWLRKRGCNWRLSRVLRRATHPLPERRYPDMTALQSALRSSLSGRGGKAAAGFVVLGLAAAAIASSLADPSAPTCELSATLAMDQWTDERKAAIAAVWSGSDLPFASGGAERFEAGVDDVVQRWGTARAWVCEARRTGELTTAEFDRAALCLRSAVREVDTLLSVVAQGERSVLSRALRAVAPDTGPHPCTRPQQGVADPPPIGTAARASVDAAQHQFGSIKALLATAEYDKGLAVSERALADARASKHAVTVAEAEFWMGVLEVSSGNNERGSELIESAYLGAQGQRADSLAAAAAVRLVSVQGYHLSNAENAQTWARRAEAAIERSGEEPRRRAALDYNLGLVAVVAADRRRAEEKFTAALATYEAVGDESSAVTCLVSLGAAVRDADPARALEIFDRAQRRLSRVVGAEHPDVANVLVNRAVALRGVGRGEQAREAYLEALQIQRTALGEAHPTVGSTLVNLAAAEYDCGQYETSLELFVQALQVLETALPEEHPHLATTRDNVGATLLRLGRAEEALAHHRKAIELRRRALGPSHELVALGHANLGAAMLELGRYDDAELELRRAWEAFVGSEAPQVEATLLTFEGDLRRRAPSFGDALAKLRSAWELRASVSGASDAAARTSLVYGLALAQAGQSDAARERLEHAASTFRALGNTREAEAARKEVASLGR